MMLDDEVGPATADRRRGGARPTMTQLAIFAVVAAMAVIAVAGFRPALSSWDFLSAGTVGAVAATAIALLAHRRLLLGESVALSALGFVVLGGVAVRGVPTPDAYREFLDGLVNGWADLLSSPAPTDITPELRVLPYTIAWFAAGVGAELARHARRPGVPIVGPVLGLALTLLFNVFEQRVALAQGAGLLAGTFALISLGQWAAPRTVAEADETSTLEGRTVAGHRLRLALGALVVLGAVGAAPWLGPRLPLADAHERFDLRRYQQPPFDPLALPSPLVQVKANLKEPRREATVFTVTGPPVSLLPVAVMTDYDGVVWTVGDPDTSPDQAQFAPVDSQLPPLERTIPAAAPRATHHFEIEAQGGYFLPTAGSPTALTMPEGTEPYMNLDTGTIALRQGARPGLAYDVTSAVPPTVSDEAMADATIPVVDHSDELELLPPTVRNVAADLTQGQDQGWAQMAAIRDRFVGDPANASAGGGFYDVTEQTPPGHSYGRIEQMLADPDRIVGFEEQYAAAAAVIGRVVGLPTRVVVGYQIPPEADWTDPDEPLAVPASWISAWVEIDAGALGWVPVLVTPDRDREPDPETESATEVPIAIPSPPPPPPPPPEIQPPRQDEEELAPEEEFNPIGHTWDAGGPDVATLVAVGAAGAPLVLLLVFVAVVMSWKALRRRRRRRSPTTAGRVAGAWAEAVDRSLEAGAALPVSVTPREAVRSYALARPERDVVVDELAQLVRQLDRSVYAADPPNDEHVERAWSASDRVAAELRSGRSAPARMRMRLDPRPLRRDPTKIGARP